MLVQIHPVQFKADAKLLEFIDEKIGKLPTFYSKIERADIYLKLDNKAASVKEKIVEIRLHIPGNDLFASQTSNVFEAAFDLCMDQIKKQLIKHKEKIAV